MSSRPIRELDARGTLVAAGYEWGEEKDTPGLPLYLLTGAGVAAALAGLWVTLVGSPSIGLPIVLAGIAVAWVSHRARRAYGQTRRSLIFRTDNTIAAPYGLARELAPGTMPIKLSELADLAFDLQYDTPYIALVTTGGCRIEVLDNRGLTDDEGRLIHAQLVQAWQEVRRTMTG
jgi:hypothetical protein